jgi:hypothetical protein
LSNGESFDTVLDSLTIQGCSPGISLTTSSLTIRNSIIQNCTGYFSTQGDQQHCLILIVVAGGILATDGSLFIYNTHFKYIAGSTAGGASTITLTTAVSGAGVYSYLLSDNNWFFNDLRRVSTASYTAIQFGTLYSAEISDCSFESNTGALSFVTGSTSLNTRISVVNTSFYNNNLTVTCANNITVTEYTNNAYCGTVSITCSNWPPVTSVTEIGTCNICDSLFDPQDCDNICWGDHTLDKSSPQLCCLEGDLDCTGICYGNYADDNYGTCCLATDIDCGGVCNGPRKLDSYGTCCANASSIDCNGTCNGPYVKDADSQCCLSNSILQPYSISLRIRY